MVGTALYMIPFGRFLGLPLLLLAAPLAYESVRRKINTRVMYVNGTVEKLDHKTLKFWMQVKAMGSKLIVGFPNKKTDMILNACACSCVDEVVAEAPEKIDLHFLEKQGIDYVMLSAGQSKFVTDEVLNASRCLEMGGDGIVRPAKSKAGKKE
jgi:glycerol-3-phosphate cytidylyltransferase-like family protein